MQQHHWLVHRIHDDALMRHLYVSGTLVDIGCGEKPYVTMTKGLVKEHIGEDHVETQHDHTGEVEADTGSYITIMVKP